MRILGFSVKWPKLLEPEFTTFRLCRRDKDWQVSELVQVVFKPRSKEREILGIAVILSKEPRRLCGSSVPHYRYITAYEAIEDGFNSLSDMEAWLLKAHGGRIREELINKLTVRWVVCPKYTTMTAVR